MILHFLEVWGLLLVSCAIGALLGAMTYELLAMTGMARSQEAVAGIIGRGVDWFRERLGVSQSWREYQYLPTELTPSQPAPPAVENAEVASPPFVEPAPQAEAEVQPAESPVAALPEPPPLKALAAPEPEDAETESDDNVLAAMRPVGLTRPRKNVPDNLQKISGIGRKNEKILNDLGIFHFGQIAAWTPAEIRWIAQRIAFPERIERDDWIGQATLLASGVDTGIEKADERRRARRNALFVDEQDPAQDHYDDFDDDPDDYEAEEADWYELDTGETTGDEPDSDEDDLSKSPDADDEHDQDDPDEEDDDEAARGNG